MHHDQNAFACSEGTDLARKPKAPPLVPAKVLPDNPEKQGEPAVSDRTRPNRAFAAIPEPRCLDDQQPALRKLRAATQLEGNPCPQRQTSRPSAARSACAKIRNAAHASMT